MFKTYGEWLEEAKEHRLNLHKAITNNNTKEIIYYRGKYIRCLKNAYKIQKDGFVPHEVSGLDHSIKIIKILNYELNMHQKLINNEIKNNKSNSNIKNNTLSIELGLKLRRLSTRVSQASLLDESKSAVLKDAASFSGSLIKAPIMVSAKVISAIGPLTIKLISLPFSLFASLLAFNSENSKSEEQRKKEKEKKINRTSPYYDNVVTKMSNSLCEVVKNLSNKAYKGIGKI